MLLTGAGWVSAWVLLMELFGWRALTNRRQLASLADLVPSPYNSGAMIRDRGISKAGNQRVRALMIQLARWWQEAPATIGIVALAQRLLINLWRFVKSGVVPEGARLTVA